MSQPGAAVLVILGLGLGSCSPEPGEPADAPRREAASEHDAAPADPAQSVITLVDDEGYFATTEAVPGEVHPGPNIRCLLPAKHDVPAEKGLGGLYVGRLVDAERNAARDAQLYVRDGDEPFAALALAPRASASLRKRFLAALRATPAPAGAGEVAAEFATILRAATDERLEPATAQKATADTTTEASPLKHGGPGGMHTPPPGAPLEAWAGNARAFVEFRSVEAAYRFSGVANDIAGHLLRVAGDGRDYRTLWLGLHHLTLPMVWRTNPSAEKGVGEVALLVDMADRGAPSAALLLRITRADLHESQTRAGLALAAKDEYRWQPADDYFPERRDPQGARATFGDVQVVATSKGLLRRIQEGWAPGQEAAIDAARRSADEAPPSGNRALFAYVSESMGTGWASDIGPSLRRFRQTEGLRALAWHMSGVRFVPPEPDRDDERAAPHPLAGVHWVDVHTDARGATVRIETRTSPAAGKIAHALIARPPSSVEAMKTCVRNLRDIAPVALVERREPDLAERCFVWLGWAPVCPNEGTYRAHPVTGTPSCSLHGTADAPREAGSPRRPRVSSMERNNRRVTFRLAIDWSRRE